MFSRCPAPPRSFRIVALHCQGCLAECAKRLNKPKNCTAQSRFFGDQNGPKGHPNVFQKQGRKDYAKITFRELFGGGPAECASVGGGFRRGDKNIQGLANSGQGLWARAGRGLGWARHSALGIWHAIPASRGGGSLRAFRQATLAVKRDNTKGSRWSGTAREHF